MAITPIAVFGDRGRVDHTDDSAGSSKPRGRWHRVDHTGGSAGSSASLSTSMSGQGMMTSAPATSIPLAAANGRRGWLGVALQPITVPDQLVQKAGQTSGRMVVSVSVSGPADRAGLRVGDVLLALDGYSTSGSHALRAFLGADRIGRQVEVRLMRDGSILSSFLTVAAQPAGQSSGSGSGSR